jgi:uncharacterized BrkB/YihY/UPF0761 family membrane protein
VAKTLRIGSLALLLALLAAIATCALAPSSYMTELRFIPQWLGEWADRNPNFRNFPVFAALSALLFFVVVGYRPPTTRNFRWLIALGVFVFTTLIGVVLELMQRTLPGRWSDPWDVMWSTMGSLAGVLCALVLAGISDRKLRSPATPPASQQTAVHGV